MPEFEVRSELDSSARGGGGWLRAPGGAVNTRSIHYTTCLDPECLGQTYLTEAEDLELSA